MGVVFSRRRTTNPGPREPDLGCDSFEVDDNDFTTSYMEVSFPLNIKMEPASRDSSWINLVYDDKSTKPAVPATNGAVTQNHGIYQSMRRGSITPVPVRPTMTMAELTLPENSTLPKLPSSNTESQKSLLNLSQEEKQYRGVAIAETLQEMSGELVDAIDPSETACHLFGYGIISIDECNAATLEATCKKQRSTDLILILIRKLKKEPLWLKDACKALDNTGAHSVVERLQAVVKEKWLQYTPDDIKGKSADDDIFGKSGDSYNNHLDDDAVEILPSSQLSELDLAYKSGGEEAARKLLQDQPVEQNICLIQDACKEGIDPTFLEVLLSVCSSLCDVNGRDEHGRTGLHTTCASSSKSKRIKSEEQKIKTWKLLEKGADSGIQDEDGNTALHVAVKSENIETCKLLLKHSPDVINIQNNERRTPLHISTMNQLPLLTAELVKPKCCNLCLRDKDDKTPLHYAASSGEAELVKLLLNKRHSAVFVDATDSSGDTALHIATREGHKDVMKLLLKFNADTRAQNNEGKTPFDIAEEKGIFKAIKVLLKKKYPMSWRFKLQKMNVKRSASLTKLPTSASAASFKSTNSGTPSSTCSDINATSSGVDLDNLED